MTTVAELKRQALELLGRLRLGQSFQTQDDVAMQESYNEVYASIENLGYATWVIAGPVPDELVPPVIHLMAFNRATVYGISDSRFARVLPQAGEAMRTIALFVTPAYESLEEPSEF